MNDEKIRKILLIVIIVVLVVAIIFVFSRYISLKNNNENVETDTIPNNIETLKERQNELNQLQKQLTDKSNTNENQ